MLECEHCHKEYEEANSDALDAERFCSAECEDEVLGEEDDDDGA